MLKKRFNENLKVSDFLADDGTRFQKGPFKINGIKYDFKLIDVFGEDYCSIGQMQKWNVIVKKIIE